MALLSETDIVQGKAHQCNRMSIFYSYKSIPIQQIWCTKNNVVVKNTMFFKEIYFKKFTSEKI